MPAATRAGKAYDYSIVNEYDDEGRITATGYSYVTEYFTYDGDGQLTRVDNGTNVDRYTAAYSYDSRGNVTSKKVYDYTRNETITSAPEETTTFTYANTGWKDQLVAVNDVELTYDANGNVLTYGDREYEWESGRNLKKITDGENTYSYTYDESGIRTSKTVNGVTTYYNTKDGVIQSQTDGTNTWYFQYDANGTPLGFIRNGVQYFYFTNQMGDVLSIADAGGDELVEYEYDEWGNTIDIIPTDSNSQEQLALANANPLRYRGYYYDNETGYYYLQSRYYDPSICRFINSDKLQYVTIQENILSGINVFVYCCNDPINNVDYDGCDAIAAVLVTFAWPTVIQFLTVFATYFWAVVAIIAAVGITVWAIKKIVQYAKNKSGKKAKDNSKNEPHGNEAAKKKAEKQAKDLKNQAKKAKNKKERKKLLQKAKNVLENGKKQRKGETHHRK